MPERDPESEGWHEVRDNQDGALTLAFMGRMDVSTAAGMLRDAGARIARRKPRAVRADLSGVRHFDDYGALVLHEIRKALPEGSRFEVVPAPGRISELLTHIDFTPDETCRLPRRRHSRNVPLLLGGAVLAEAKNARAILAFLGELALALAHVVRRPKSLRAEDTLIHMEHAGASALPVVALISALVGMTMAFMAAIQFRQFGADIYVASLVAFGMVSELGPVMTAIIVAGRSGSAFAAEIGTMKVSEEIDALRAMGFDPARFLAVPRLLATLLVMPFLALFSNIFAIAGGMIVGVFMLDISAHSYIKQSLSAIDLTEVVWGMFKSAVFGGLIAFAGCLRGFAARGGASAVGSAATSAVVTSIFLIIVADAIFAVIRAYWGW